MSTRASTTRFDWRAILAELAGTFLFVFMAVSLVVVTAYRADPSGLFTVAVGQGLAFAVCVAITAPISGGHLNPAVTLASLLAGGVRPPQGAAYIVAQFVGAGVAAVFASALLPVESVAATKLGAVEVAGAMGMSKAFALEALLTAVLVSAWYAAVARDTQRRPASAMLVGAALGVAVLVAGPITGAALNPARAFGPAMVAGGVQGQWLYWVAPLLGAVIAGTAMRLALPLDAVQHRTM